MGFFMSTKIGWIVAFATGTVSQSQSLYGGSQLGWFGTESSLFFSSFNLPAAECRCCDRKLIYLHQCCMMVIRPVPLPTACSGGRYWVLYLYLVCKLSYMKRLPKDKNSRNGFFFFFHSTVTFTKIQKYALYNQYSLLLTKRALGCGGQECFPSTTLHLSRAVAPKLWGWTTRKSMSRMNVIFW